VQNQCADLTEFLLSVLVLINCLSHPNINYVEVKCQGLFVNV